MWGLEAKAFSGPLINFVDDLSHVPIAEIINVFSLWDVLPDQTISVFVEAPLPGMIGVREEALGSQLAGDLFMVSKLYDVTKLLKVENCLHLCFNLLKSTSARLEFL